MKINADIFKAMETWAPKHLAYSWDNIGLQIGNAKNTVKKVLVTLDVLENVVDEAISEGVDLIIAHHPLLFKPLKQLDTSTPKGRIVEKLITNGITVYAAHTNLDIAKNGMNDILSELLSIEKPENLIATESEKLLKIAVYVPESHEEEMRAAMADADAGHIGNYSHCTFRYNGTGTFKPEKGTNPYIGKEGKIEHVSEMKIETVINESTLNKTLQRINEAHPYEVPAIDIYALENEGINYGLGKVGKLEKSMKLQDFCAFAKDRLGMEHIRFTGDPDQIVETCAVLGGSGEKYIAAAYNKGADVYVTGDVTFHAAQDAEALGMALVDAGHYIEKAIKKEAAAYLEGLFGTEIEVLVSTVNTDPFRFV